MNVNKEDAYRIVRLALYREYRNDVERWMTVLDERLTNKQVAKWVSVLILITVACGSGDFKIGVWFVIGAAILGGAWQPNPVNNTEISWDQIHPGLVQTQSFKDLCALVEAGNSLHMQICKGLYSNCRHWMTAEWQRRRQELKEVRTSRAELAQRTF